MTDSDKTRSASIRPNMRVLIFIAASVAGMTWYLIPEVQYSAAMHHLYLHASVEDNGYWEWRIILHRLCLVVPFIMLAVYLLRIPSVSGVWAIACNRAAQLVPIPNIYGGVFAVTIVLFGSFIYAILSAIVLAIIGFVSAVLGNAVIVLSSLHKLFTGARKLVRPPVSSDDLLAIMPRWRHVGFVLVLVVAFFASLEAYRQYGSDHGIVFFAVAYAAIMGLHGILMHLLTEQQWPERRAYPQIVWAWLAPIWTVGYCAIWATSIAFYRIIELSPQPPSEIVSAIFIASFIGALLLTFDWATIKWMSYLDGPRIRDLATSIREAEKADAEIQQSQEDEKSISEILDAIKAHVADEKKS